MKGKRGWDGVQAIYMPAYMSSDQNHVYLLYIGNYTTQLYIIIGVMI